RPWARHRGWLQDWVEDFRQARHPCSTRPWRAKLLERTAEGAAPCFQEMTRNRKPQARLQPRQASRLFVHDVSRDERRTHAARKFVAEERRIPALALERLGRHAPVLPGIEHDQVRR